MFKLKFLPATIGDAIWITYGPDDHPHYMLIDGGTGGTRKHIKAEINAIASATPTVDLVVVSHMDKDHINGIRTLLEREETDVEIAEFWYNGFHHLPVIEDHDDEMLGAKQGEALTEVLVEQGVNWNERFDRDAVAIADEGPLPEFTFPGGMKITLLGPTAGALADLRPVWIKEVTDAGMLPGAVVPDDDEEDDDDEFLGGADFLTADDVADLADSPFPGDGSKANGSSIAIVAEFDGKRALFAADAHADHMLDALERLSPGEPLDVDIFKVSHHGSKGTTNRELIEKVSTSRYVFSTNGSIFKHPDDEAVAKVLTFGGNNPELIFNYRKATNTVWENPSLQDDLAYTTLYPDEGDEGIEIEV